MNNSRDIGAIGEDIAIKYLRENGYVILERNFRTKTGEIDIIASINDIIVFIEVKTRNSDKYGFPYEAVNYKKQQKIIKVAQNYINLRRLNDYQYRFDIIEIFLNSQARVNHIENAFWT